MVGCPFNYLLSILIIKKGGKLAKMTTKNIAIMSIITTNAAENALSVKRKLSLNNVKIAHFYD
ncbi:MAG: hypothetical protein WAX77_05585 [Methylococcaceae bacterium]